MLKDSKVDLSEKSLIISLTNFGSLRIVLFELFCVVLAYWIMHQFVLIGLDRGYNLSYLLYLLPGLLIWNLFKRTKALVFGQQFHFDKNLNELTLNGLRQCGLDEVDSVEINYVIKNDSNDRFLELKLRNKRKIRIRDFGLKRALVRDGREIARFLKIKMIDNYPHGKELLWGEADVDSKSIAYINEHLKEEN